MPAQVSLPIFPLPDLTFFPHTMLPLHIFEARYRAMITDCLSRDRRLAVVGLLPGYEASYEGKPAVHAICGVGRIVQWERLASGRFNLLLRGEGRVRIERELPTDTLYRMVRGHPARRDGRRRRRRWPRWALGSRRAASRSSRPWAGRTRTSWPEEGLDQPAELCRSGGGRADPDAGRPVRPSWRSSTSSGGSSGSPMRWTPS